MHIAKKGTANEILGTHKPHPPFSDEGANLRSTSKKHTTPARRYVLKRGSAQKYVEKLGGKSADLI